MKDTNTEVRACQDVQARLDFYIDNELQTETNLAVSEHFERCGACAREADDRRELRMKLQATVRQAAVPTDLERRVRERIRESSRPQSAPWRLMAIAAAVLACVGSWVTYQRGGFAIANSPQLAAILHVGFGDHLHCAVIRQRNNPGRGVDKLSMPFKPVLAFARNRVPADMPLAIAHECTYEGRKFIHMTFRNDRNLVSLIITRRKDGESLRSAGIRPALSQSGVALYAGAVEQFQAAAFESNEYIVYTISDLPRDRNLGILSAVAPTLQTLLDRIPS
jgi:anti-sigma factor (TIGR02949 family)